MRSQFIGAPDTDPCGVGARSSTYSRFHLNLGTRFERRARLTFSVAENLKPETPKLVVC